MKKYSLLFTFLTFLPLNSQEQISLLYQIQKVVKQNELGQHYIGNLEEIDEAVSCYVSHYEEFFSESDLHDSIADKIDAVIEYKKKKGQWSFPKEREGKFVFRDERQLKLYYTNIQYIEDTIRNFINDKIEVNQKIWHKFDENKNLVFQAFKRKKEEINRKEKDKAILKYFFYFE